MKTDPNELAFFNENGLTKREWYAGMAMSGFNGNSFLKASSKSIAKDAVEMADALIEALNK